MRFIDQGFVIRIIPFEEEKRIITVFTKEHGVYQGLSAVPVGTLTHVQGRWSSRTQGLGYWNLEEIPATCHRRLNEDNSYRHQLTLQVLCDLLYNVLPPRHLYPTVYEGLSSYLQLIIYTQPEIQKNHATLTDPDFCQNDRLQQFINLLFLILHELGYGTIDSLPVETTGALKLAFSLFLQHCQWQSPYAQLLLSTISPSSQTSPNARRNTKVPNQ